MTEPIDHDRRVFRIPVTYEVKCQLFVLALDIVSARRMAEAMTDSQFDELVGFDDIQLWVNTPERLKIADIIVTSDSVNLVDARIDPDYSPDDHPDWAPFPVR